MKAKKKILAPAVPKTAIHYTDEYIINPPHPVTVNVIGCGGTGSQVLNSLGRMGSALKALGHPGLFVRAIDPDRVTSANMGRQLFSPADVDEYKCVALIGRLNRFFGTDWEGVPTLFSQKAKVSPANITISCVDTGAARKEIKATLMRSGLSTEEKERLLRIAVHSTRANINNVTWSEAQDYLLQPYQKPFYWLDFGNLRDRGQAVMATIRKIKQPVSSDYDCQEILPSVDKLHPDIFLDKKGEDQGPSCSLADALNKQDLFINTNLANMGLGILWKMFREAHIRFHGLYVNLETMIVNPIPITNRH